MKKIPLCLTVLLFAAQSCCQTNTSELNKKMYLEKSKRQKSTGWILLGSGAGVALIGSIVLAGASNADDIYQGLNKTSSGVVIAGIGASAMIASIPFFISAGHNAHRAAAISFNNQNFLIPQQKGVALKIQPALTLKISL